MKKILLLITLQIIFLSSHLFAQLPVTTNLQLWLKADAGVTKDGSNNVSDWADQSGNAHHANQSTPASQPLWVDNVVNGKPVIRFDGNSDLMTTDVTGPGGTELTFFVVAKSNGQRIISYNDNTGYVLYSYATPNNFIISNDGGPYGGLNSGTNNALSFQVTCARYIANTTNGMQTFVNGALLAQRTSANIVLPSVPLQLGSYPGGGATELINGDVAEIIIYNRALTDVEREQVENYLTQKYPLPPANDDCTGATNLIIGSDQCNATVYSGDTQLATASTGVVAATCDASANIKDVWYQFTPETNGTVSIEITNGSGTFITQVLTGTCGSFTEVGCFSGTNLNTFSVTANTTYYVRIYVANGSGSFNIKAYKQLVSGAFDFEHSVYYTASGNALTNSNQTLQGFNYSTASSAHPLLNDGVYFAITNLTGKNIWMRVRHVASDPNGSGTGFNVTATASSPFRSGGFGGWWGFLYQFDIYQDANLDGCRSNTLSGLYPVNIVMESIETLSQPEWLMFENLNPESSNWILNSISFTGNNPGSNPGFSATNIPYPSPFPGGFTSTFPAASKNIYAIDLGGGSYAEFKMSANNVSQFKYGYEYSYSGGYQGIRLSFGTAVVVPLNLLRFEVLKNKTTVQLSWQTTNEINTSHFTLQRSANGTIFNIIGRVEAKNTSGNNDYSFTDANPVDGVNFYRLQMVDIDGKTTYSSIIKIVFAGKNELLVFPNPAKNTITISGLQSKGAIKIMAADGKVVKQIVVVANTSKIDVSTLAKGFYLIQYNDEGKMQQVKFVKE
ncbi:MAG: T9SS type A sorting domain-containing protein [Ginsengibacter sp.]